MDNSNENSSSFQLLTSSEEIEASERIINEQSNEQSNEESNE